MKRYRRPKVIEGQIKFQRGRLDGDVDMCMYYGDNTPKPDRNLVMNTFCFNDYDFINKKPKRSFIKELELRGYDLDTLKFSIKKLPT